MNNSKRIDIFYFAGIISIILSLITTGISYFIDWLWIIGAASYISGVVYFTIMAILIVYEVMKLK